MMSKEEKEFIKRINKYPSKHTSRDVLVSRYLNYPPDYDRGYYIMQKTVSNIMYDMGLEEFRDYVIKLTSKWHTGALERRDINFKRIHALKIPNNEEIYFYNGDKMKNEIKVNKIKVKKPLNKTIIRREYSNNERFLGYIEKDYSLNEYVAVKSDFKNLKYITKRFKYFKEARFFVIKGEKND